MSTSPSATVVVTARDRWAQAPSTLEALLACTDPRHQVVVVDGGAPRTVSAALTRLAASGRISVAERSGFLGSNEARNIGAEGAQTEWLAFVENDAALSENWLEVLLAAGERLDAVTVYPAYLELGRLGPQVHGLGVELEVTGSQDARRLCERHFELGQPWPEVAANLAEVKRPQAEPHAIVIRREFVEQLGGFDEDLLSWFDHIDLALHQMKRGASAWLIPQANCTYLGPRPVALADRRTFSLRWGADWYDRSLEHLCRTWGLDATDPGWRSHRDYRTSIRRQTLTPWPRVNAVIDRGAVPVDRLVARQWHRHRSPTY